MQDDITIHSHHCPLALRWKLRDCLTQESRVDLNNGRRRFIPRGTLYNIIDYPNVLELLVAISGSMLNNEQNAEDLQKTATDLCPEPGACFCRRTDCTGGRMLFATLLLLGKEDVLLSFYSSSDPRICDSALPLRFSALGDDNALHALASALNETERKLFEYFQWQVVTPLIVRWDQNASVGPSSGEPDEPDERVYTFPEEISLPWSYLATEVRGRDRGIQLELEVQGQRTLVNKVQIYAENHDLVSYLPSARGQWTISYLYRLHVLGKLPETPQFLICIDKRQR